MSAVLVEGFDYRTGKPMALAAAEWRRTFPADRFKRSILRTSAATETQYYARGVGGGTTGNLVAEAYAVVPA